MEAAMAQYRHAEYEVWEAGTFIRKTLSLFFAPNSISKKYPNSSTGLFPNRFTGARQSKPWPFFVDSFNDCVVHLNFSSPLT